MRVDARICPRCGNYGSRVYDVRDQNDGTVLRRRICTTCNFKWQTIELERLQYESMLDKTEQHNKEANVMAKEGKWVYYTNDENKPRWKCSNCGKICRRDPYDKNYCSKCGSRNTKEA